ncbi:MAG: anti-sigma factor domain-containing protein [Bacillota bacterium]|nr:anti-sigma factor domain-containing protein [Bacillota bacterium]
MKMINKGLLVKLNKNDAIVMSDNGRFERIILRDNMQIGMRIQFTDDDLIKSTHYRKEFVMNAKTKIISAVAVMAIVAVGVLGYPLINQPNEEAIAQVDQGLEVADVIEVAETMNFSAIVTVDINPSFKLSVDEDDKVVEIKAMNDDAKTIKVDDLVGIPVENAVEQIVQRSNEAGFIDLTDLDDDFVLISVANVNEDDDEKESEQAEKILEAIKEKAKESNTLKDVTLAMAEVDEETMNEAEKNSLIAGIMIFTDSQNMTVKEFFEDEDNLNKFLASNDVIPQDIENKIKLMSEYLDDLDDSSMNKETLDLAFRASKDTFFEAKELFQQANDDYKAALESGDQAKIAAAKIVLDAAEAFKDQMEQAKDDVESIKEVLKSIYEGDDSSEMKDQEKDEMDKIIKRNLKEQEKLEAEEQRRIEKQEKKDDKNND